MINERDVHVTEINRVQRERDTVTRERDTVTRERDTVTRERDELRARYRTAIEHLERYVEINGFSSNAKPEDVLDDLDEHTDDVEKFLLLFADPRPQNYGRRRDDAPAPRAVTPLKVYIVTGKTGEYSDRQEWLVAAYLKEDRAARRVTECSRVAAEIFANGHGELYDKNSEASKLAETVDESMKMDYTGTEYRIDEVDLIDDVKGDSNDAR